MLALEVTKKEHLRKVARDGNETPTEYHVFASGTSFSPLLPDGVPIQKAEIKPLPVRTEGPVKNVMIKSAQESYMYMAHAGEKKQHLPIWKLILLGMSAGMYIGFGYALAATIAGELAGFTPGSEMRIDNPGLFNLVYGASGLPFGLLMTILTGAELFTSNTSYLIAGAFEGKVGAYGLAKSWIVSWLSNLLGALILQWLFVAGNIFHGHEEFIIFLATKKTHYPWKVAFVKGILCNWCVNLAVFQANMAEDLTGKFVGVWLPISAFMSMGFEHSVASMFIIPLGISLGAPTVNVHSFIVHNEIPVTLGNIVGGGILVATGFALTYGRPAEFIQRQYDAALRRAFGERYERFLEKWEMWPINTTDSHKDNRKPMKITSYHGH